MALDQWREDSNLVIATDSANAMKGMNRQLRNQQQLKHHVHKYLLKAIGDVLIERARLGLQGSIIKVKSHIGVQGNTIADAVAGRPQHRLRSTSQDSTQNHITTWQG